MRTPYDDILKLNTDLFVPIYGTYTQRVFNACFHCLHGTKHIIITWFYIFVLAVLCRFRIWSNQWKSLNRNSEFCNLAIRWQYVDRHIQSHSPISYVDFHYACVSPKLSSLRLHNTIRFAFRLNLYSWLTNIRRKCQLHAFTILLFLRIGLCSELCLSGVVFLIYFLL